MSGSLTIKRVLILGSGRVSGSVIEYLFRDDAIHLTICSQLKDELDRFAAQYSRVNCVYLKVTENIDRLVSLCASNDVVISLLPYDLHGLVGQCCIAAGTHMVTASYVTDSVRALNESAKQTNVTILNEVGLDPGIDHFLALECIRDVEKNGGTIESFISYCGGLPAPEYAADNPLRYKFSWSPRGALLNTLSAAEYLWNGKIVKVAAGGDVLVSPRELNILPDASLEGFPNRDSMHYKDLYGFGPGLTTLLRGSIRYKGFAECARALQLLGLINTQPNPLLDANGPDVTWKQFVAHQVGLSAGGASMEDLKGQLEEKLGINSESIRELGLLDDVAIVKLGTPLDSLSYYLAEKLSFGPSERDLVILRHEIIVQWSDNTREKKTIDFIVMGKSAEEGGHTAMALTVGYPVAIATQMILNGQIKERGVILPFSDDIYLPILSCLRAEGLNSTETTTTLN